MQTITSGGWKKCFVSTYNSNDDSIDPILKTCSGSRLMLACKYLEASTIKLLAWADRSDVLHETTSTSPTHNAQGASWYFTPNNDIGNSNSWGFAKAGDENARHDAGLILSQTLNQAQINPWVTFISKCVILYSGSV